MSAHERTEELRDAVFERVVLMWVHNRRRYGVTSAEVYRWIQSGPLGERFPHRGSTANALAALVKAGDLRELEDGFRPTAQGAGRYWGV